jgi:hypothetical protein
MTKRKTGLERPYKPSPLFLYQQPVCHIGLGAIKALKSQPVQLHFTDKEVGFRE